MAGGMHAGAAADVEGDAAASGGRVTGGTVVGRLAMRGADGQPWRQCQRVSQATRRSVSAETRVPSSSVAAQSPSAASTSWSRWTMTW